MDRPEGAVLLSSGSRSAPINLRPGHALHEATLPLALLLQELLPQVRRRRRRRYEEKEAASEPAELDEAIGFWRSSRLAEHQISSSLLREGPEYFISHLWQPADQAQSRETYAEEKTALLKSWAITHKALLGEDRQIRTPWFLLETEQDRRMALLDPKNAWHNMRCWVDKACAHRGFPGAAPPQEALRATKAAMAHCRTFLAVLSHGGYFRRLWCCYEWAFFAARAAPHYRSLEVLLPESLQQPGPWKELLRSVAGFRLEELRCSGETMKLELWQDLKELAVDDDGFEGFVRATALALLTLQALLRQAETCAAFGSASLEAASEACEVAGLRGLGKILNTAQPMIWWRSAYRQQRTERQRMVSKENREKTPGLPERDPLEALARFVDRKFFDREPDPEPGEAELQEEDAEEEPIEEDAVVEPEDSPGGISTLAAAAKAAARLAAEGGSLDSPGEGVEVEEAPEQFKFMRPRDAAELAMRGCKEAALGRARPNKVELGEGQSWRLQLGRLHSISEVAPEAAEEKTPGGFSSPLRGEEESNAWRKLLKRSGAGVPEGYLEFWKGVQGNNLEEDERARAGIFFRSWEVYQRRVWKWFDTQVVPHLEVWRQRGVRSRGIVEEAFGDAFLRVGGSVQEELCKQLCEGSTAPWTNPCLDRLLVLSRKQATVLRGGCEQKDRAMLPAILLSPLPLELGQEPGSSVVCAKPSESAEWRRACVAQKLGATALTNAVYQLLTNFAAPGCTVPGVHAEVLVPRMVLQVRGTKCEVVCGLRVTGHLQEGQRPATSEEGGGSSADNESGTETADDPSGTSSDLAETQEMCVDWSPWILKAQEKQVPRLDVTRRPKSPKVVVTELHVEEGQGLSPRLRPRKWWAEPSGAAERLLPEGVAAKPQKLPLIGELRAWRPKADLERGLQRSWRREKPAEPRLPQIGSKVAPAPQMWVLAPQTARAQMLKSVDCHMLKKSHWLWCFLLEGGPRPPSVPATVEEKLCCLQEHFERLYSQVERSCFAQWVTLNSASESQNRPMRTGSYTGGGGCLRPPQWKAVEKPQSAQPEFLHAATCEHCQGPLVRQDLEGSMMALVWKTPVCILCLRCGFAKPDDGTRAEMLSEQVLEVTTSLLVRPGHAEQLQRCIVRVLRLENNCCCVAMPREASSTRPTRSLSRVASVSFAAPSAAMAAAATVVKRSQLDAHERRSRPFACDESWITNSLADTGLDLYYGKVRQLSVEVALEELDDKRMLRLRQEVSPMLLWLELAYVLSPEFSLILWNRALIEVFGSVTLPAAILMRMNINRLRHVAGAGPIPTQDPDTAAPARWPLKLHRVLLAPAPTWQETLAVAMEGSGLIHGGLEALFQMGQSFQEQHYSGADEAFAKEMVEGMQDVDKTSVNTIMTILSKTRSAFGSNPRALLQARRILKRKQVFLFLRGLYETIVAGHGAKEWLRVGTQQGEESDDSSNSDFKDEEERACDDEDLRIHAPLEVERQMEKQNHPQGLTIIKVLGHFSEYIHFSQMALMCIQVLGEMLRAALRLKESTVRPRGSNLASDAAQSVVLEQVILNHNFVPTALRALYRHPSSPDIVKETLTLLKYLVNEDAGHNEHVQARQQLSSPPLKPLTLMLTVSKLSDLEDRGNLLLCLQVYLIIAQDGQGKPVVSLPPEREPEAALIMTTVFKAHFPDQAVVELMLKILQLSCEQPQLCRRLFEQGLTGVLRSFLRKARRGKVHDSWFEDVKTRRGMKVAGKGIGSLKRAKEIAQAQLRVTEALRRAEKRCWQMLRKLAVNTAGLQGLGSEVDPNYRADAAKSIAQALQEMREERGPQWLLAVEYLEAVLVYDLASHGHFFAEQGGLALVMAELPYGQVDAVYPLLVAVLRLQLRRIPAAPQSHVLSDTEEVDRRRSDSFPRCRDAELRPLAQRVGKRRKSAPDFEYEKAESTVECLVSNAKETFAKSNAVSTLLWSLMLVKDQALQDGMLRVLSELLQESVLGAEDAATEFQNFDGMSAGGAQVILDLLENNLGKRQRVAAALYTLTGTLALSPGAEEGFATEQGARLLIQTVWKYWTDRDTRRRCLALLRTIRDANPTLTAFMLQRWKAHMSSLENGEDPGEPRAESAEPGSDPETGSAESAASEPPVRSKSEASQRGTSQCASERGAASMPVTSFSRPGTGKNGAPKDETPLPKDEEIAKDEMRKESEEHLEEPLEQQADPQDELEVEELQEARKDSNSKSRRNSKSVPEAKIEVTLPREMRHFLALLKVHRFEQKSSFLAIRDVVQAIVDFGEDMELARFGVKSLMSGVPLEQEMRMPTIARCPGFVAAIRRMLQKETHPDAFYLVSRLILGILDNDPTDYEGWVDVAALTVAKMLQVTGSWTSTAWEVMLQIIAEALRTPQGKQLVFNFNIVLALTKAWDKLRSNDDTLSKMLISSYHDQTERTLEMLT